MAMLGEEADPAVAEMEIEQHAGGDRGHVEAPGGKPPALLFQEGHDAVGRSQAERAATRQDDGVHASDEVLGAQRVHAARGRRRAAQLARPDGSGRT